MGDLKARFTSCGYLIALGITLGACSTGKIYTVSPLTTDSVALAAGSSIPPAIDLTTLTLQGENLPAVQSATLDPTGSMRNRLKSLLVNRSKLICQYTEAEIVGTNDWINFGLGEFTTVLGGAGALVTAATPARVLSGLAGLVNSSRTQVNEIFYQNAVKVAIIQKIDSLREARLALINSHNRDSLASYSLEDMLSDVSDYHKDCSFFVGISSLTQPAAPAASDQTSSSGGGRDPKPSVVSVGQGRIASAGPVTAGPGTTFTPEQVAGFGSAGQVAPPRRTPLAGAVTPAEQTLTLPQLHAIQDVLGTPRSQSFDVATRNAIKEYQATMSSPTNPPGFISNVGERSRLLSLPRMPSAFATPYERFRFGLEPMLDRPDTGKVKSLQLMIGAPLTGVFDASTREKIGQMRGDNKPQIDSAQADKFAF